jgi:REP element-mobilizing transposase RayT
MWIRDRIQGLQGVFGVDVYGYTVMGNHLHVILRMDPALVSSWTDEEVARRWLTIFPGPGGKRGQASEDLAVLALCQDPVRLALCRERLSDVSWFMRCLNEPIARRANREDDCTGRFWEGRFKCQRLEDAGALLACMAYVDLNPVRAGLADTPEASDFTSAQDRSVALRARRQLASDPAATQAPTPEQKTMLEKARAEATRDSWLVPFGSSGNNDESTGARAWLSGITEEDYLQLLDWTGREIRAGKRGRLSDDLRPVLERLDLDVEAWTENVKRYGSLFHRLTGKITRLRAWAQAKGRAWLHGHRGARLLYAKPA